MTKTIRNALAEALGVMVFVTSIVAVNHNPPLRNLAFAGTLVLMILLTSKVSGAYLNPAVTFFFYARKKISLVTMLQYWLAQLVGAALGLYLGTVISGTSLTAEKPTAPISQSGAFIGEIFSIVVLILIITQLNKNKQDKLVPFAIGIWVLAASTFTLTGAQANPAVTFALLLRDGFTQDNLYIVVAEFLGAIIAMVFVVLFDDKKSKKKK